MLSLTSKENNTSWSEIAEAHELAKPHVKDALVILSDDNPSNDGQGYINLANTFIAVNDYVNALAVYHHLRPMMKGGAVLAADAKGSHARGTSDAGRSEEKAEESETQDRTAGAEPKTSKDDDQEETDEEDDDDDEDYDDDDCWTCDGLCVRSLTTSTMPSFVVWAARYSARAAIPCSSRTRSLSVSVAGLTNT